MTPYYPDAMGVMFPEMPTKCIFSKQGEECHILVHHLRGRKTGPQYTLSVASCIIHGCTFTLYPHGHVPYGRFAVAPVTSSGELIQGKAGKEDLWRGTVFDVVISASLGTPGSREAMSGEGSSWSSQGRILTLAMQLVGVEPGMDGDLRHEVAEVLSVPMLTLLEGAARIRENPGYRSRGEAVKSVLDVIPTGNVLRLVLVAGAIAGLWGRPMMWDPSVRVLRPLLSFQLPGTHPP